MNKTEIIKLKTKLLVIGDIIKCIYSDNIVSDFIITEITDNEIVTYDSEYVVKAYLKREHFLLSVTDELIVHLDQVSINNYTNPNKLYNTWMFTTMSIHNSCLPPFHKRSKLIKDV